MAEWYYIGHYGQLGPLTTEQMDELVQGGVITSETYVWKTGMLQWQLADSVPELRGSFQQTSPFMAPPPPPTFNDPRMSPPPQARPNPSNPAYRAAPAPVSTYGAMSPYVDTSLAVRSDRSRTLGGILQLILPGVGRMYLGYFAYGALQLVLCLCTLGILYIWSFIDGIIILAGGLKFDGFGRVLTD